MTREFWGTGNRFSLAVFKRRFLENIEIDQVTNCWNWKGPRSDRYANVHFQGKLWLAHRLSWLLFKGEDPKELKVCHICDNGFCVNYEQHLFLGTQHDNILDMENKGRAYHKAGELHGRAKLTWDDAREIRERSRKGESLASISRSFPFVHKTNVHRIILNKGWINHQTISVDDS